MESNMDISSFFPQEEWESLSEYAKLRYRNILENYMKMCEIGLTPAKPHFMKTNVQQRKNNPPYCDMEYKSETVSKYPEKLTSSTAESCGSIKSAIPQVMNGQNEVSSLPNGITEEATQDFMGFTTKEIRVKPVGYKMLLQVIKKLEKEIEELESKGVEAKNKESRRYPRRSVPCKNYTEDDIPNDDDYIFCDECDKEWEGDCPFHGPLIIVEDIKVPPNPNDPTRAERTLPSMLVIAQSAIPNAGKGVWTREPLAKGLRFGPYEGTITDASNNNGYCWQVRQNRRTVYCIDAYPKGTSNWMRYVNCARHVDEQNLIAFQYKGQIYYRTLCYIAAHVELLVWYGEEFGRELGIDVTAFQKPQNKCLKVGVSSEDEEDVRSEVCLKCGEIVSELVVKKKKKTCESEKRKVCVVDIQLGGVRNKTGEKPYQCDTCGKCFTTARNVRRHNMIHTGEKPFTCDICSYKCSTSSSLTRHRRIHTGDKPYACDICTYKCRTSAHLREHKRTHTGEKPFVCNFCTYKCRTSAHLREHKRTHTGEKPFVCNFCTYKCSRSSNLTQHRRIHTGDKPYACDICTYKCRTSAHLREHKRTHTGEKPFVCNFCTYKCSRSSNLTQHRRIHTGDKPFVCKICSNAYTQSSTLVRHLQIHSANKHYKCTHCDFQTIHQQSLIRHKLTHSKDKSYVC